MQKLTIYIFLTFISFSVLAKDALPANYTLTGPDYELVGNGKYDNFDLRNADSNPLIILLKLDQILNNNFTYTNDDKVAVTFDTYDGTRATVTWDLYVEDMRFRTTEYVLSDLVPNYLNLGSSSTLDICTWNIEHYPKTNYSEENVATIIKDSEIDIFALQEISDDAGEFRSLLSTLGSEYDGYIYNPTVETDPFWDQNVGFIFKKDEISVVEAGHEILELKDDTEAFPRTPIEIKFKHKSGIEFVVINIHLKCCDDSADRRLSASTQLKTYIETNYKSTRVVLLGDMNDRIDSGEINNVFDNFIDDPDYYFTDTQVSEDSNDGTGWPNIDHILINKPLFDINDSDASTLKIEDFDFDYDTNVSDHFPVWVNLNVELLGNEVGYVYKHKVSIYPNPSSSDFVNIDLPSNIKNGEIVIFNSLGKEITKKQFSNTSINISTLPKGIYIVEIKAEGKTYSGQFVKE